MKKLLYTLLFLCALACQQKQKPNDLEHQLKKAMTAFLYETVNNDSARVQFQVTEVAYFKDTEFYECEFQVRMKQEGLDTIGAMKARITKDFSKVLRKL